MPADFIYSGAFPEMTRDDPQERIDEILDYIFKLTEQLRHTLHNLGQANINASELETLTANIQRPLYTRIDAESTERKEQAQALSDRIAGTERDIISLSATVSGLEIRTGAVETALAGKADKATTLSGYGITDAYTKTEADSALASKADKATTLSGYGIADAYTKTEIDTALSGKAGKAATLSGYGIMDAYTRAGIDAIILQLAVTPVITVQPENAAAEAGETVTFHVSAVGGGLTYQWQYSKNSGGSWSNVGSSIPSRLTDTLTFTASGNYNGYLYRCRITDGGGNIITSAAAELTVE